MNDPFKEAKYEHQGWEPPSDFVIPEGFADTSWHNDICPSFEKEHEGGFIRIWVDYVDPDKRECGGKQYAVVWYDQDLDPIVDVGNCDTYEELIAILTKENAL